MGELFSDLGIDDSVLLPFGEFLLHLSGSGSLLGGLLSLSTNVNAIVVVVPLGEGRSVDLHNAVLHKSLGSNQLVVGGVVHNVQNSSFAGNLLGGPVEVSFFESEGSELVVSSSDSNSSDSSGIRNKLGVGDWSSLLESSLFLVDWHAATGESSLVSGVSVDTHCYLSHTNIILFSFILIIKIENIIYKL